jgi:hypothetical protein
MDETIETLMVGVRADTDAFARDAAEMQATLIDCMKTGGQKGGGLIEASLLKAVRTGKLSFDDLGKTALAVLSQIAAQAVKAGIGAILGGGKGKDDGLLSVGTGLLGSLLGVPGRATGGPVSPGRAIVSASRGRSCSCPPRPGASLRPVRVAGARCGWRSMSTRRPVASRRRWRAPAGRWRGPSPARWLRRSAEPWDTGWPAPTMRSGRRNARRGGSSGSIRAFGP